MSRNKTLALSLLLLAFICFQAQASLFNSQSLRNTIMNAHATSSGRIELKRDDYSTGFYVEADLSYYPYNSPSNSSNATNSTNATSAAGTVKMMISIPNEETMVAQSCASFSFYDCSQYSNCYKYSWTQNIDYPAFSAYTTVARGDMYLDYSYWSLSSAYLYIAQSCQSYQSSLGYGRYGVLGLGTGGSAGADFSLYKIFSININSDLNGGSLLFKNDASNIAVSSSPKYSFYSNSTWQTQIYSGYIKVSYGAVSFAGNLVFDVNSDTIGIPYNTYKSFISYFTSYSSTYCTSENYRPTCSLYSGSSFDNLPDIIINLDGIDLRIPSQIYASKISDGSFYLNFRATSPSLGGNSYVTPSFQSSIILDTHFMSYYYTVFDASSGYNYVKIYEKGTYPFTYNWWTNAGIAGAVLFVVLLCCCCCSKKKRIPKNTATIAQINNTTMNNTTQAPLIYNQQGTVAPNYTYDLNAYNYAGYNAQPQYPGYNAGYQQPQVYAPAPGYIQPQAAPGVYTQEQAKQ